MKECLELPDFDEVWIMPSGDRLDKHIESSDVDRINMLNRVKQSEFNGINKLVISSFELQLPRPTQTYRTLGELALEYKNTDFWLTFGADAYLNMPKWKNGLEMQSSANMIIFERDDTAIPDRPGIKKVKLKSCEQLSSTEARTAVRSGKSLSGLVSDSVADYIKRKNLYAD
jgi:nicotinate-nucleotide adenylyltransferase